VRWASGGDESSRGLQRAIRSLRSFEQFSATVREQRLRTDFGYRQIDIEDAVTAGWTECTIKPWQKRSLLDSIDWNNCHLIAE
jgi:hypothetical protein